jgi:hypothetical protein
MCPDEQGDGEGRPGPRLVADGGRPPSGKEECGSCGNTIDAGTTYCPHCGTHKRDRGSGDGADGGSSRRSANVSRRRTDDGGNSRDGGSDTSRSTSKFSGGKSGRKGYDSRSDSGGRDRQNSRDDGRGDRGPSKRSDRGEERPSKRERSNRGEERRSKRGRGGRSGSGGDGRGQREHGRSERAGRESGSGGRERGGTGSAGGGGRRTPDDDEEFCASCGEIIDASAAVCPECGDKRRSTASDTRSGEGASSESSRGQPPQRSGASSASSTAGGSGSPDVTTTEPASTGTTSTPPVVEAVNCQRCGSKVTSDQWFCTYCGKERPQCPSCGAEMDEEQCKNCETPRKAPCGECGLMISASKEECPHCGYNRSEEVGQKSEGRKKKALALGGGGVVAFFVVSGMVPGPSIIGQAVGALAALPLLSWGGLTAFYYSRKETKAQDMTAAELSKGREQNKTKEWRAKEREQRKKALEATASVAGAAGKAASSYMDKKKKDEQVDELSSQLEETAEYAQQKETEAQKAKQEKKKMKQSPDLPSKCPRCGTSWTGGIIGSGNVERFSNGRKASCTECSHTELLFRE